MYLGSYKSSRVVSLRRNLFFLTVGNKNSHFSCFYQRTEVFNPVGAGRGEPRPAHPRFCFPGPNWDGLSEQASTSTSGANLREKNRQLPHLWNLHILKLFCTGWTQLLRAAPAPTLYLPSGDHLTPNVCKGWKDPTPYKSNSTPNIKI